MTGIIKMYYRIRPLVPKTVRVCLRRSLMHYQRSHCRDTWPINPLTATKPPGWQGWPDNKKFALVLTHDVESASGIGRCEPLMDLEEDLGFRSSFNFVPDRYTTPPDLRRKLKERGFEIGVHGLLHDGRLYASEEIFAKRVERINQYLASWDAVGFRSPSMHHNLEWLHALNILYDSSTFDVDPFEPDKEPLGTIFPAWVPQSHQREGYVELPYTLPQDSSLFLYLREKDIRIWKEKLDWIKRKGGMALINTHPDYMQFTSKENRLYGYPSGLYRELLQYIRNRYDGMYWHVLPREAAAFAAKNREQLTTVVM